LIPRTVDFAKRQSAILKFKRRVSSRMSIETVVSAPDIVCEGCANAIRNALGKLPGVEQVSVDVAAKTVKVKHQENFAREKIIAALDDAGFPVE
jgi:copper chaperone